MEDDDEVVWTGGEGDGGGESGMIYGVNHDEECIARRCFMGFIDDTDDGNFNDLELIYSLPFSVPDFYRILCLRKQQSLP